MVASAVFHRAKRLAFEALVHEDGTNRQSDLLLLLSRLRPLR
jgi:hypothetical protein